MILFLIELFLFSIMNIEIVLVEFVLFVGRVLFFVMVLVMFYLCSFFGLLYDVIFCGLSSDYLG